MASRRKRARELSFGDAPFIEPPSQPSSDAAERARLTSSRSAGCLSTISESSQSGNHPDVAQSGADPDPSLYTQTDADVDSSRAKLVEHSSFNPSANAWVPSMPARVSSLFFPTLPPSFLALDMNDTHRPNSGPAPMMALLWPLSTPKLETVPLLMLEIILDLQLRTLLQFRLEILRQMWSATMFQAWAEMLYPLSNMILAHLHLLTFLCLLESRLSPDIHRAMIIKCPPKTKAKLALTMFPLLWLIPLTMTREPRPACLRKATWTVEASMDMQSQCMI